ncbi:hypothetical protein [Halodesulfovibrio sp. MK-HDV]|uniref:hypothetical protein n=1 Tax=Halodesulfovibrio sp. MK-HDV TaxID=2599925 RepID=UPI001371EFF4|nr:hypothetical protein [Halodesulfovibrio sp. MK-HDV]
MVGPNVISIIKLESEIFIIGSSRKAMENKPVTADVSSNCDIFLNFKPLQLAKVERWLMLVSSCVKSF